MINEKTNNIRRDLQQPVNHSQNHFLNISATLTFQVVSGNISEGDVSQYAHTAPFEINPCVGSSYISPSSASQN